MQEKEKWIVLIIVLICPLKAEGGKIDTIGNRIRHSLKYRSPALYFLKGINMRQEIADAQNGDKNQSSINLCS